MNDLKYIVIEIPGYKTFSAIIFRGMLPHHTMKPKGAVVLGAGFCKVESVTGEIVVTCFGEATSLEVKSRGIKDAEQVRKTLECDHSYLVY